ncbi:hypothetical protein DH2020_027734 [Rehmannia glutinosa]|uniref:Disease resistance protein n=1 Tax=Rehmannia glutinosa TaxID=99300 RepID=A0ABR0VTC8_REHGL
MAEAVVSIALETLRDLLLEEARFLSGVSKEAKGLEKQLKEIQCLLQDADRRKHESKTVLNWIAEIKDLTYRSEDAIEAYAFHVSSRRGWASNFKHLRQRFSRALNHIASEISEVRSEIARVSKSMQEYGIRSIIQRESSSANPCDQNQQWKRQTFPFEIFEDCFVGKEDELKQLVSLVVDQDKQNRVISIWGMGGIGKTTIAKKVYNHIETKHRFECFAWVCITQQCQIRSVLEEVLKQLISHKREDITKLSKAELIQQLCEIQKAKRCMVVLDDIWEIDHWAGLKHAFLFEGSSSKVLLTTRKQNVAAVGFPFELELLNIDDGLELLINKAFPHTNIPDFPFEEKWLQKVGKEMVCKCGYLPLVISLLGGILSKRKSLKEWETVNQNINAYLYKGDEIEKENEIHAVLNLSYEDLPYYLKPCFLYMGQFREDDTILVNTLYRLWIAQGMILHEHQENEDDTLMDVAELYLSELASRCIVQVEVENVIRETKYRSFKLHDVVRDMCLSKGTKEGFCCHVINPDRNRPITSLLLGTKTLRHLAVDFGSEMEIRRDDDQLRITTSHDQDTGKHVRSLQFLNDLRGKTIEFPENVVDFHEFKVLRVLVFQNFNFSGRKLPRGFGNLIHLRYLRFQNCAIDELPSSIANFRYLHTLSLRGCWNVRVPNILKKMIRLKHLLLPSYNTRLVGNYRLRLEGLDELETLSGFNSLVHDLKSVTRMKNLRRIRATVHDKQSLWTIIDAINTYWKNLRPCALLIANGCQFTSTEEGVMILERVFAYPHLYDLRINVKIGNLLEECENQVIISKIRTLFLFDRRIEA